MASIGTFNKITNLWPARPSRPIEQFGLRKKPFQQKQQDRKQDDKNEIEDDGPGKNIDEYV